MIRYPIFTHTEILTASHHHEQVNALLSWMKNISDFFTFGPRIVFLYVFLRPYISDLSNFAHIIITFWGIRNILKHKFHNCKPGTLAGGASCEKKAPEEALAAAKEMLGDAWRVEIVSWKRSSYVNDVCLCRLMYKGSLKEEDIPRYTITCT